MTQIDIGQVTSLGLSTSAVRIDNIGYDMTTGYWTINVAFVINKPSRNTGNDKSTNIFETHNIAARTIVTGTEIAKEANLPEGVSASTLTGQELQTHVLTIATAKVLAALQ